MNQNTVTKTILVRIGDRVFEAELVGNKTSDSFLARLPLTLEMKDLNGNEKYYYFKDKYPTNSQPVWKIRMGDLLLYGNDCLVVFYKSFNTPYEYTRIGNIANPAGLLEALGPGTVKVTFSKK